MLDFTPIRNKKTTWEKYSADLTKEDLVKQTNQMTDKILELVADCSDGDVVFQPTDPDAHDPYAKDSDDVSLAWNLGHIIVHITASSEEAAFLAAELARGVEVKPRRSRWEVPWETATTIGQCRHRLEESRRMLFASLEMWPDEPHLENYYMASSKMVITPVIRFLYGQSHADSHLEQIAEIIRQAKAG